MKRSLGERPVRSPVCTTRAPLDANSPSPRMTDISARIAALRSEYFTVFTVFSKSRAIKKGTCDTCVNYT